MGGVFFVSEKEKRLLFQTSAILGKDTSQMKLNDIIEELIDVILTAETDQI
jgi:hypothetical protein